MLRSCYSTKIAFYADRPDILTLVRWYFTTQPPLAVPTAFVSRVWNAESGEWAETLGEVCGESRSWRNGSVPPGTNRDGKPVGTADEWFNGCSLESLGRRKGCGSFQVGGNGLVLMPPRPGSLGGFQVGGNGLVLAGYNASLLAGVLWGGDSSVSVTPPPHVYAGMLWGGDSSILLTPPPHIEASMLWGGDSSVLVTPPPHMEASMLWGGDASITTGGGSVSVPCAPSVPTVLTVDRVAATGWFASMPSTWTVTWDPLSSIWVSDTIVMPDGPIQFYLECLGSDGSGFRTNEPYFVAPDVGWTLSPFDMSFTGGDPSHTGSVTLRFHS